MKYLLPLILAVAYSCASISADWSPWKVITVAQRNQVWRFCSADKDGVDFHRKGFCFVAAECRTKNPWYTGAKKECRALRSFCAYGDIECMDLNGLFNKVLVDEGELK